MSVGTTLSFFSPTPVLPTQTSTATSLSLSVEPTITACSQSLLEWDYNGPSGDSMIIGIYGARSDSPSSAIEKTIDTLDNNIVGLNSAFWTVDVAQGVYLLSATIPSLDLVANSSSILVFNGTDTSCLNSPALPISFSPLPSTGSTSSTDSSSTPTSSGNDSATNAPVTGAVTGSHSMSSGAVAGAVVGAIAGIALVAILIFFLKRCRSRSAGGALGSAGVFEKRPRGAVAIGSRGGSFSSAHGRFGADTDGFGASRYHADATTEPAYPSGNSIGRANSVESSASAHGPSIEKLWEQNNGPFSSPYDVAAAVAMPLNTHIASTSHSKHGSTGSVFSGSTAVPSPGGLASGAGVKPSRHSSLLYPIDPFGTQPNTPSPRPSGEYFDPYGVGQGARQGQVPVQLFSPPSNASAANSLGAQSLQAIPRDISSASSSSPDLADELLAMGLAAAISVGDSPTSARRPPPPPPLPRTSSGDGRPRGKTTRKPAPTYAPSVSGETLELVEPSTPRSTGMSSNVTTPTTAVETNFAHMKSPIHFSAKRGSIDQHSRASAAPSSSVGNDWSSAAAHSHSTPSPAPSAVHLPNPLSEHWPELNHKSSFGDRQVHYLIPDPPSSAMK